MGKVIYIMRTGKKDGSVYESAPVVRAVDSATESRLVLLALRDALGRLVYACETVIHTECFPVAAAINNGWPQAWQAKGWQTVKGQPVKDGAFWENILFEMEDAGHILRAECGKHEFSLWMRNELPRLAAGRQGFEAVEQKILLSVGDKY